MLGNGFSKLRNLRNGADLVKSVKVVSRFCFSTEIQESARHLLGKKDYYSPGREEDKDMLTSWEHSSLVVDRLGDQARGQNAAVTCFYFDWAPRKEQSATSMLGSLLRQMVSGMERIPEEISRAFKEQRKIIGGRGPRLVDIVGMLEVATSSRPTFMCIDGLDECVGVQLPKVLGSLKQILDNSPVTRIFISGRFHIRGEVERALAGRVVTLSIAPAKGDIIEYLHARLGEDETRDAMNERLEADILEKIPQRISQMCVRVAMTRFSSYIIG